MNIYKNKITLTKNKRGVWDLDPFKGCSYGIKNNKNGCYGICYALKMARRGGYNFGVDVKRYFISDEHFYKVANKLKTIPFVRLGNSCDPSSDWEHTLKIVERIKPFTKNIVIITKHWNNIKDEQLYLLHGVCVNTSISAFDTKQQISHRLLQYNRLKQYCNSVLRVNTAEFIDTKLNKIQYELLKNEKVIDNVLRFPQNHKLVKNGTIVVNKYKFLDTYVYASKHDKHIYFSYCNDCKEQCGVTL